MNPGWPTCTRSMVRAKRRPTNRSQCPGLALIRTPASPPFLKVLADKAVLAGLCELEAGFRVHAEGPHEAIELEVVLEGRVAWPCALGRLCECAAKCRKVVAERRGFGVAALPGGIVR
jgi:hypothetical protein